MLCHHYLHLWIMCLWQSCDGPVACSRYNLRLICRSLTWCILWFQGHPFSNKRWDTCAVIGNGGIVANSSCGKMINSADFVIRWEKCWKKISHIWKLPYLNSCLFFRCNLPPLSNGYEKDVGTKTNLVTANPTILFKKWVAKPLRLFCHLKNITDWFFSHYIYICRFESLVGRRRPLMEKLSSYGNSMLLLPAFSFGMNTAVCMRTLYTIQDFESAIQPAFINPEYLIKLSKFWHAHGLKEARLSTGVMMTSLALELCDNVHLYGFWPFGIHPFNFKNLTNHYYDDMKPNTNFHSMPVEFSILLQLHRNGVLRLHLGDCQ